MGRIARALVAIGSVLVVAGLLAGFVNSQLLDARSFARHADAVRTDGAVADRAGVAFADAAIAERPDLTAVRPLLETAGSSLFASAAFGPAFRASVEPVHRALFTGGDDRLVVRVADAGLLLSAAAREHVPGFSAQVPSDVDARLAQVADGSPTARTVRAAGVVDTLAWLLPLLAIACFGAAAGLRRELRTTLRGIGIGVGTGGLVVTAGVLVTTLVVDRVEISTFATAVGVAGWHELAGSLLWLGVGTAAGGFALAYVTELVADRRSHAELLSGLADRRNAFGWQVGSAALLAILGVCAVLAPLTVLRVVVSLSGAAAVAVGVVRLVDLLGEALLARLRAGRGRPAVARPRRRLVVVAAGAGLLLVLGASWNGVAGDTTYPDGPAGPVTATVCNGSAELCGRAYDAVAFPGTHNSMAAADEPGWFKAEQPTGVIGQLDDGIRLFLIDTWYGSRTNRGSIVATAGPSRARAEAEARRTYGDRAVDSALRLAHAARLTPEGRTEVYLCHGMCELGSTLLEPLLVRVRAWLERHPQEVITLFLQDQVSPEATARVFEAAGLVPMTYTPTAGEPWPTLGEMVESGRRVVVLSENESGGTTYPWLLPGFEWVQDTPYDSRRVSDLTCDLNRGRPGSPLVLVNHWLNNADRRVTDARRVNAAEVLGPRLDRCVAERGHVNQVAVDFYDQGDLFAEVDRLNGF